MAYLACTDCHSVKAEVNQLKCPDGLISGTIMLACFGAFFQSGRMDRAVLHHWFSTLQGKSLAFQVLILLKQVLCQLHLR